MAEHETIADIIAEIRALSNPISDGIIAINGKSIANRLEAALKRERGDSAKLREALTKVKEWMERRIATCGFEFSATFPTMLPTMLEDVVLPALAAPPRNCDLYRTKEKAQEAFLKEPCDHPCGNCWVEDINNECGVEWLLATATKKEGGVK